MKTTKTSRRSSADAGATPRGRRRHRRRTLLLIGALALVLASLAVVLGLTCRPAWYQPTSVDFNTLEADKAALVNQLDEIGRALNRGDAIELELTDEQINRWIAARHQIWVDRDDLDVAPLEHPMVLVLPGQRIRFAATYPTALGRTVVSAEIAPQLTRGRLELRLAAARIGVVPGPTSLLEPALQRVDPRRLSQVDGRFEGDVLSLQNRFIWENGRQPFEITEIATDNGNLRVTLTPLPRDR